MNIKRIVWILFFSLSLCLGAEETPEVFKNSSIKRKLKNGKTQSFDGNKYKIVKRGTKRKSTKPQKTVVKEKRVYKKNAIKLYLGTGPSELKPQGNNLVDLDHDTFVGIGYQRMLTEDFSLEAVGTTNKSIMIGGGFHF